MTNYSDTLNELWLIYIILRDGGAYKAGVFTFKPCVAGEFQSSSSYFK